MPIINNYKAVSQIILNSKYLVVFTGAGMSIESGIPTFTGKNGLWNKYDPKYIELDYFYSNPQKSWVEIKKIFYDFMLDSTKPNYGHNTIANLYKKGIVKGVITQNIDGLHQKAGCDNVLEFHGTISQLICTKCANKITFSHQYLNQLPPVCPKCCGILKPNFIFYGEQINPDVYQQSLNLILKADVILIIGTAAEVYPANQLPILAKNNKNCVIIEVNPCKTNYTKTITDYYFDNKVTEFFKKLSS